MQINVIVQSKKNDCSCFDVSYELHGNHEDSYQVKEIVWLINSLQESHPPSWKIPRANEIEEKEVYRLKMSNKNRTFIFDMYHLFTLYMFVTKRHFCI